MALERTFTIPLRREWLKTVKYKRAKKAVRAIREFLERHMKAEPENIKLGRYLNLELWKHSIKNPPSRVKVAAAKDDKGIVRAELVGAPKEAPKEEKEAVPKKAEKNPEVAPEKKPEAPAPKAVEKEPVPAATKDLAKTKQPPKPKQQPQTVPQTGIGIR